jgi:hypothetical protein
VVDKTLANQSDKRPEREKRQAGQVKHDERGNAVWHWATDTARTAIHSTSQLLRKLDVSSLSLESDAHSDEQEQAGSGGKDPPLDKSLGKPSVAQKRSFDPYSSNAATAKRASRPAVAAPPAAATRSAASKPHRSWWRRLLGRD